MKFARLIQQYKYNSESWNGEGNIGDCIQNIAVRNLYKQMGISDNELVKINRDDIPNYSAEQVILPMQGWFGNVHGVFPLDIPDNITPVYVGLHINSGNNCRDIFIQKNLAAKMKAFEPIGCRDRNTADFLESLGVKTYFSGCLTLTFPKRENEPENGKIFIVDLAQKTLENLPDFILEQADYSITHRYKFKNYPVSYKEAMEFESKAEEILERYKNEAKLVITSRIHSAMPCIAMGIPVIYIHKSNYKNDSRLDVINGLIPAYNPEQIDIIDWSPKAPDIEGLKKIIIENSTLHMCKVSQDYHPEKSCYQLENCMKNLRKMSDSLEKKAKFAELVLGLKHSIHCKKNEFKLFKLLYSKKKTVIWGASRYIEDFIRKYHIHNSNIVGIIDKNPEREGSFICGYEVFTPEILSIFKPDVVVFAIKNNHNKIYREVKSFLNQNYPEIKLHEDIM